MIRLAIIFGGKSMEHNQSLKSVSSILSAIDKTKYEIIMIGITKEGKWLLYDGPTEMIETGEWRDYAELKLLAEPERYDLKVICSTGSLKNYVDVVFPILHGAYGEDGAVQGLLETIGVPYVGCGINGAALAMDKALADSVFRAAGLPVCQWKVYYRDEIGDKLQSVIESVEESFSYPVFVKPSSLSASIGVSKAHDTEELKNSLKTAAEKGRKIIVEEFVDCREIEVGIIGNTVPQASAVGEVLFNGEYFDTETKFSEELGFRRNVPAEIPADVAQKAKELAIKAYKEIDLRGFARVDLFLEKGTNKLYINEVNAIPSFSNNGIFSKLWETVGLEYSELIDRLIGYALEK